ncbi:MAG: SDR family NAD(P)-dependent oxidoreductase, partial [Desulfobacterales bacterium]|nr:SDR family NAD(P)-dependent oxidoreductase [Desulfobacterales bacterium]
MPMSSLKDKNVWITGASSGIGLEMAVVAAEAGANLCLFSSRKDPLAEAARLCAAKGAASVRFEAIDLSLTDKAESVAAGVLEAAGAPDYLILNAGVSQRSKALDTDIATSRKIIDLNFFGAVAMARAVLPAMIDAGGGNIGV